MGVLRTKALPFGVYATAPAFWKLPCSLRETWSEGFGVEGFGFSLVLTACAVPLARTIEAA